MPEVDPLAVHCRCGAWRWEPCKTRKGNLAKQPCLWRIHNAKILKRLGMLATRREQCSANTDE